MPDRVVVIASLLVRAFWVVDCCGGSGVLVWRMLQMSHP